LRVTLARVSPDEIKKLREELGCSLGDLSRYVGVEPKTLLAWEAGDLFPTKRHVSRLEAARKPGAVPRSTPKPAPGGLEALSDPRLWAIITKLVTRPEFFAEVEKIAARY
jgi:transcriptional regulator with XRE-family HTH domain